MNAVVALESLPAPLSAEQQLALGRLVEGFAPAELYWLAAWSAARAAQVQHGGLSAPVAAQAKPATKRLTILYGSQTGNAKRIAEQLAERCEATGLPVRLQRADRYPQRELAQESHLIMVISTQGEGEPPDDARGLVEFLFGKRAPTLPTLRFAVLGLGDSSYPQFCVIGKQIDARLAELGGTRFAPFGEADVDFEAVSTAWSTKALDEAREALSSIPATARVMPLHAVPSRSAYTRDKPFAAPVLANQRIVSSNHSRDVRHLELSLRGSGLHYAPGDSLGVWPSNPPALVAQWLAALQLDGTSEVTLEGRTLPLGQWLGREREITRLHRGFVAALAARSGSGELMRLLRPEQSSEFAALLASDQPIDLLRRYPAVWDAAELVAALRLLTPRLYSIASSPRYVDEEVHLTVAVVDYEAHGEQHWGAASGFLAAVDDDGTVPVFIEPNDRFRLPADATRDVIMIGPGTGIAPFRAFVQERQETAASGRNWLFFGNRHFSEDFLYQTEWLEALRTGALHRLDLAFSRDDASKVYVQDRLRERGAEVYAWLEAGAFLYVCGDSAHMAKDVHAALVDLAVIHGGRSAEDARTWLNELLQEGRYARDVY